MVALSNFPDMVRTAVSENADVIFAGAGLPLDLPGYLTEGSRTQLVPIVSSSRAARLICEKWSANYGYLPDAIVVEGPKAREGTWVSKRSRSKTSTTRWSI